MTRTVFANGKIFDGTGSPLADGDVAVAGGRIVEVGSGLDGDEAVDLGGRALLPGFYDCHVHVMFDNVDIWGIMQKPFSLNFYEATHALRRTLATGITSIREAGKRADFVVVEGDPTEFATLKERVTAVYLDGALVSGALA